MYRIWVILGLHLLKYKAKQVFFEQAKIHYKTAECLIVLCEQFNSIIHIGLPVRCIEFGSIWDHMLLNTTVKLLICEQANIHYKTAEFLTVLRERFNTIKSLGFLSGV